jgi:hypothetical protein
MKRAPHVVNCSLNRTLHRLRTNGHAQIKISKRRQLMTPMGCGAYRPKFRKLMRLFPENAPCNQPVQSDPEHPNTTNPHRHH